MKIDVFCPICVSKMDNRFNANDVSGLYECFKCNISFTISHDLYKKD